MSKMPGQTEKKIDIIHIRVFLFYWWKLHTEVTSRYVLAHFIGVTMSSTMKWGLNIIHGGVRGRGITKVVDQENVGINMRIILKQNWEEMVWGGGCVNWIDLLEFILAPRCKWDIRSSGVLRILRFVVIDLRLRTACRSSRFKPSR